MGVTHTQSDHTRVYTAALVYRNPNNQQTRNWSQPGQAVPDPTGLSAKLDPQRQPFGLGAGKTVDSTGTFLYQDELGGPIEKFQVQNRGNETVYIGINVSSGSWVVADGLAVASGDSFELGDSGTQVIRNVWAITSSLTATVEGYATNIPSYRTLN